MNSRRVQTCIVSSAGAVRDVFFEIEPITDIRIGCHVQRFQPLKNMSQAPRVIRASWQAASFPVFYTSEYRRGYTATQQGTETQNIQKAIPVFDFLILPGRESNRRLKRRGDLYYKMHGLFESLEGLRITYDLLYRWCIELDYQAKTVDTISGHISQNLFRQTQFEI